ncbi:MAG: SGNH/GDSL hydrolase family protein [Kiritimatiellia bacterium]
MRTARKILLSLAALLFSLGLGEWAVRAFHLGPDVFRLQLGMVRLTPDPRIRYELVPHYVSPLRDVAINSRGMRNRPVEPAKPSGVFRIACIGDSVAFGMGTPRDHFGVQLEERLNGSPPSGGPPFEVLNFGVPGYNVEQVAATLETRVGAFDPDLVVYLYCLNDPQETSRELEVTLGRRGGSPARQAYVRQCWAASRSALGGSRLGLLARYAWVSLFAERAAAPRERYRDDMEILLGGGGAPYYRSLYGAGASRDRFHAGLDAVARWSRETGVPVWVAVMPVFLDLEAYPLEDLHAVVGAALAERGLPVLDLLDVYRDARRNGAAEFHADPLHPNREGYGLAARAVEEALRSGGALEGRGRK